MTRRSLQIVDHSATGRHIHIAAFPAVSAYGRSRVALYPLGVRVHEILQKFARAIIREHALLIEFVSDAADIRLRHLHARHVEKNERLPQVVVGAEGADRAERNAYHRARLSVPYAFSVGARAHVDRVLEWSWDGAIVLGRHEQYRIVRLYLLAKRRPRGRRVSGVVEVRVIERQLTDLDDFRLQRVWRKRDQCLCDLPAPRRRAKTADKNCDSFFHGLPLSY